MEALPYVDPPVSWHSDTGTIYFIGYFHGINAKPKDRSNIKIGPAFLVLWPRETLFG
ncbi:hypothetical protein E8E15_008016 [Penicillium rubens]|uniref:Uncharacterized protein n=1 Tax=Penicillium chrysogenum TaxID=5076 RepID=A0A162BEK4_PENCH|nr:hypothetical protein E8E15_008016 [Penicillium rubens]KZN84179.1 hypothetical protein EN45_112980 [Penicillium chrysogenum]